MTSLAPWAAGLATLINHAPVNSAVLKSDAPVANTVVEQVINKAPQQDVFQLAQTTRLLKEYYCERPQQEKRKTKTGNSFNVWMQECRAILSRRPFPKNAASRLVQSVNIAYNENKAQAVMTNLNTQNLTRREANALLQTMIKSADANGAKYLYIFGNNPEDKENLANNGFKPLKTIPHTPFIQTFNWGKPALVKQL